MISIIFVIAGILATRIEYVDYNKSAQYLSYLLTPATVSLAVPLYKNLEILKKNAVAIITGILSGILANMVCIFLLAVKYINSKRTKTNVDDLIGKEAKVTEKIDNLNQTGRVVLNGMDWSTRTTIGGTIDVDTIVRVVDVKGVKLIVEPVISDGVSGFSAGMV